MPSASAPPILVLGAGGMVGSALGRELERRGLAHELRTRAELDLSDLSAVDALAGGGWRCVINAAAWTDVDGAESDEAGAMLVNAEAVGRLASACARLGAVLVHYSTDYVFAGDGTLPYAVDAATGPINAYGRSKLAGERAIAASSAEHVVIRTSWVYAAGGRNFVLTMRRLLGERDELRVVDDQVGRPTSADQLASATLDLLDAGARGTFHVTGGGEPCSWRGFAEAIGAHGGSRAVVRGCTTAEFPRPAARPAWSVLDLSLTESAIGPMRPWREELARVLDEIERQAAASGSSPSGRGARAQ